MELECDFQKVIVISLQKYLKIKKKYKICIDNSGVRIMVMMCAFFMGKYSTSYKGRIIIKSFVKTNIKKVIIRRFLLATNSVINKIQHFLYFSLRKAQSTFTIERVVNILYWKNKSK